jgi:cellulose synthase/poly-beta-1,6-N-acetylglucosamine synthase-like glycosyltransferase
MFIPSPWNFPVTLAANLLSLFLLCTWLFYLVLSLRVFFRRPVPRPAPGPLRRFAVVLPAYNEETVLPMALDSLKRLDYPKELFEIYVVADHCTDATARLAREAGVKVLEYNEGAPGGKGHAIRRASAEIMAAGTYDALCFFDADSLAHPGFLAAMSAHLNRGETAIQGNEIPKNPRTNWLTRTLYVSQVLFNRLYQYPKHALGFSASLHGKGMCFTCGVMKAFPWDGAFLTEDIELQIRLVRYGTRIYFAPDAIVYDELPADVREYFHRAVRWRTGALEVAKKHLAGIWLRTLRHLDYRALETSLRLTQTYRFSLAAALTALLFANQGHFNAIVWLFERAHGAEFHLKLFNWIPLALYPAVALIAEGAPLSYCFYYLAMIVFSLLMIVPLYIGAVRLKRNRRWHRTAHTSLLTIKEMLADNTAA